MAGFDRKMIVSVDSDGRNWTVEASFNCHSDLVDRDFHIPSGFKTDFASVPQILWNIIPPTGRYAQAAVLHDWLYRCQDQHNFTRKQCDQIFNEAMKTLNVKTWRRILIYRGVRIGGWLAWSQNKKDIEKKRGSES